mmetsp:Transcript_4745/g.7142  ORF Transcript_4745/g.7142 Transcript_4745/m.7142 type:complete len:1017 (+) Transcript_4745:916-3966(+)|eukprot:CAMPEP_0202426628 /NCGR_PEP_ID=MMETSP1345-20130828/965_1 /ASSEMBLY_ACC=CAM_ASM_000843 /TAXON_ID=342563 /ORGANISM="Fabrea Fabrea salina" /LENGTH=1016 /DNA_ID=CAMNT_0049037099 /DNA_START=878 /DNA_END=3931 /DNA_ORIENTATION=-
MSDEGLFCSICMERFNDSRHAPLVLNCGHTFCRDCLSSLQSAKSQIKCPNCNSIESRSIDALPKNFILSEIVLKTLYSNDTQVDPWACKLHPGENIAFMSQSSRQLFCSECLADKNVNDLVPLETHTINNQLKMFSDLYESVNADDLNNRANICRRLGESLEGHKLRVMQEMELAYMGALQALENQYMAFKRKIGSGFDRERDKLYDTKELFCLLKEMKTLGIPIEQMGQKLPVPKQLQMIGSLMSINEIGISSEIKKLAYTPLECQNKLEIQSKAFEVPISIAETPMLLIKGTGPSVDSSEKKVSRFGSPTNRWGIFEGRNQVEAVTFTVSQKVYCTAIGIGNAYHANKSVKLESLKVLEGNSTSSPLLCEEKNIDLFYNGNSPKVVKVPLSKCLELNEDSDYTVRVVLKGEAGVFRGGSTSRTKTVESGLTFKFKSAVYDSEDVKNGENADDGPIFDIYFKMSLENNESDLRFSRFKVVGGEFRINTERQFQLLTFSFSRAVLLNAIGMAKPNNNKKACSVSSVTIFQGKSNSSAPIYQSSSEALLTYSEESFSQQVSLSKAMKLKAGQEYTLMVELEGPVCLYTGQEFTGAVNNYNGIDFKVHTCGVEADAMFYDNMETGPILDLYTASNDASSAFLLGEVPENLSEMAGGETRLSRFEGHDKQWHLNSENQVDSFSFTFSEEVLLTGVGLGNCVKMGNFITLENMQVVLGGCTTGPVIYNSSINTCLYNHTDTNPVVKVKMERPVKICANTVYTVRLVIRGEGKAYKGKKFRGATINQPDGIVFKSMKSKMSGNEKRNGDNETAGPIFDFYYIPLESKYSLDKYKELMNLIFPKIVEKKKSLPSPGKGQEFKISRYSNFGSSWHVNNDGKQVEAITFKSSSPIYLSALGLGNAYDESRKVTIKKIQIREGPSTKSAKVYDHPSKESLINVGEESRFVRVALDPPVFIAAEKQYTIRVKYKPGTPVCRGTSVDNHPFVEGVQFEFEKATFDGGDVENGSHEVHGPIRDLYFYL